MSSLSDALPEKESSSEQCSSEQCAQSCVRPELCAPRADRLASSSEQCAQRCVRFEPQSISVDGRRCDDCKLNPSPSSASASAASPPPTTEPPDAEARDAVVDASEAGFLPALKSARFKVGTLSCTIEDGAAGTACAASFKRLAGGDSARSC